MIHCIQDIFPNFAAVSYELYYHTGDGAMPFQICYFYDINSVSCDAVVTDIGERYCDYGADKTPDSLDSDFSTTVFNGFELIPANRKNCRYIIHAPAYAGSFFGENFVRFCYIGALQLVSDLGLNSVAFPLSLIHI